MKPDISLAGFINSMKSIFKLRNVILILGVFISLIVYYIIADYYTPFKNVLNYWNAQDEEYFFYSGSKGGFYERIGIGLDELNNSDEEFKDSEITIKVKGGTAGGLDNAVQVLSSKKSFGLIQESTLSSNDELRDNINYITPLYMERLHIICKTEFVSKKLEKQEGGQYAITDLKDAKKFFGESKISIGEIGSGTRVIASYLLKVAEPDKSKLFSYSQEAGLDSLKSGDINIFMNIVGAPMKQYTKLLEESNEYQLVGVSHSLIADINKQFSTNYRVTNFKRKYPNSKISTIGSYCYLISSKDVDERINIEILRRIDRLKENFEEYQKREDKSKVQLQLSEMDFHSGVESRETDIKIEMYQSFILFLISILFSSFLAVWVLIWIFSSIKLAGYFRDTTRIYKSFFPAVPEINKDSSSIYLGILPEQASNQINNLVKGLTRLRNLKTLVRKDYETGGISESHFRNLLTSIHLALEEFRAALSRAIVNDIKLNEKGNDYITHKAMSNYFSSSYLNKDQYLMIVNMLDKNR